MSYWPSLTLNRYLVLYPVLLAAFPVLAAYSSNKERLLIGSLWPPLAGAVGVALVAWLLAGLLLRSTAKGALFASAAALLFITYGHMQNTLLVHAPVTEPVAGSHAWLLASFGMLLVILGAVLWWTRTDVARITPALNILAIALVIVPVADMTTHTAMSAAGGARAVPAQLLPDDDVEQLLRTPAEEVQPGDTQPPDIYYIILDRYPSRSSLEQHFGFDNSAFYDALEDLGFFMAHESFANYPRTFTSVASSLNMAYLDRVPEVLGRTSRDERPVHELLQDNRIQRFLKSRGYTHIHIGSWYEPLRENRFADVNHRWSLLPVTLDGFGQQVLDMTALRPLMTDRQLSHHVAAAPHQNPRLQRYSTLHQFEMLAESADVEGPKFVFAPFVVPHPPFVFDRDGDWAPVYWSHDVEEMDQAFLDQLVYTNRRTLEVLEGLIRNADNPPVVVLQSDEGPMDLPSMGGLENPTQSWPDRSDDILQVHMRVLNAYHFPGGPPAELYESISPANTFRLILNEYFGTDLELLEDRSYIYTRGLEPYNFVDATERVRHR